MAFDLTVNGTRHTIDADPTTPLLWVIREHLGLTGTKFTCGIGQCGACTLHIDGQAIRSCSVPANVAVGKRITTIEGISPDGSHPIQIAWKELDTPQCGYCQSGMIMSALALLQRRPDPSDADINASVTNICRCGTYHRVRQAIHVAVNEVIELEGDRATASSGFFSAATHQRDLPTGCARSLRRNWPKSPSWSTTPAVRAK